jgi:hypothetical protein
VNVPTGEFRALQARADAAGTAAADVAGLGELVAGLAAEIARIASSFTDVELMADLMIAARRVGVREGRAEHDPYQATAQAQQRRAGFQVLQGGSGARSPRSGSTRTHGGPAAHARAAGPGDSPGRS